MTPAARIARLAAALALSLAAAACSVAVPRTFAATLADRPPRRPTQDPEAAPPSRGNPAAMPGAEEDDDNWRWRPTVFGHWVPAMAVNADFDEEGDTDNGRFVDQGLEFDSGDGWQVGWGMATRRAEIFVRYLQADLFEVTRQTQVHVHRGAIATSSRSAASSISASARACGGSRSTPG